MNRFVTKPKSNFDIYLINTISIMLTWHICSYIPVWWVHLISFVIICAVVAFGLSGLYWHNYGEGFVLSRLRKKVFNYKKDCIYLYLASKDFVFLTSLTKNAPKLIDKICKATIIPIEERKPLFDTVCNIWTEFDKEVPGFITEKWKRAVVEYKKFEIWND